MRYVQTKEDIINNVGVPANYPGAITTSAFGPYIQVPTDNTYNNVLPTANFKLNLKPDLILRAAGRNAEVRVRLRKGLGCPRGAVHCPG